MEKILEYSMEKTSQKEGIWVNLTVTPLLDQSNKQISAIQS
jgi:hypothetical protein